MSEINAAQTESFFRVCCPGRGLFFCCGFHMNLRKPVSATGKKKNTLATIMIKKLGIRNTTIVKIMRLKVKNMMKCYSNEIKCQNFETPLQIYEIKVVIMRHLIEIVGLRLMIIRF